MYIEYQLDFDFLIINTKIPAVELSLFWHSIACINMCLLHFSTLLYIGYMIFSSMKNNKENPVLKLCRVQESIYRISKGHFIGYTKAMRGSRNMNLPAV